MIRDRRRRGIAMGSISYLPYAAPPLTANLTLALDTRTGMFTTSGGSTPAANPGDPCGELRDQSGSSHTASQGTAAARPVITAGPTPSIRGLLFDGTDDAFTSSTAISNLIGAGAHSIYSLVAVDAIDTNQANSWLNDALIADIAGGFFGVMFKALLALAYGFDGADKHADKAITLGQWMVVHARHDSGNMIVSVNGGAETSVACGNITTLTNNYGIGRGIGGFSQMRFQSIYVYSAAHSAGNVTTMINHLKSLGNVA